MRIRVTYLTIDEYAAIRVRKTCHENAAAEETYEENFRIATMQAAMYKT